MEFLLLIVIFFYILSAAGYFIFLIVQKDVFYKTGLYSVAAGFIFHTIIIGLKIFETRQIPVHNLFGTLITAAWFIAAVFIIFDYKFRFKVLGIFVSPMIVFIMTVCFIIAQKPVETNKIFDSFWFAVHIVAIFIGEAAFALACGTGILYLIQEYGIKRKKRGFFYKRLPSLTYMDSVSYVCIITGFTMITIGIVTGFVYAKIVWGHFWTWDPKEIWTTVTWLFYAALLHERLTVGWRGKRSAIMTIIGFIFILFTFIGVNFFLEGHHMDFTR